MKERYAKGRQSKPRLHRGRAAHKGPHLIVDHRHCAVQIHSTNGAKSTNIDLRVGDLAGPVAVGIAVDDELVGILKQLHNPQLSICIVLQLAHLKMCCVNVDGKGGALHAGC